MSDDADVEPSDEVAGWLDAAYADWLAHLTPAQHDALRRWQAPEARYYRAVQRGIRDGLGDEVVLSDVDELVAAIEAGALPVSLTLWRGQRSARNTFGVDADHLERLEGTVQAVPGFLAATLSREVAVAQFAQPEGPGGRLLLRLNVAAGIPAAWVAGAGNPALRSQFEVLLAPRHSLRIVEVDYSEALSLPMVRAEVM